jgi:hypothetical protein
MSLTPVPPERRGHVTWIVSEQTEGGYAARCPRCGAARPTRENRTGVLLVYKRPWFTHGFFLARKFSLQLQIKTTRDAGCEFPRTPTFLAQDGVEHEFRQFRVSGVARYRCTTHIHHAAYLSTAPTGCGQRSSLATS